MLVPFLIAASLIGLWTIAAFLAGIVFARSDGKLQLAAMYFLAQFAAAFAVLIVFVNTSFAGLIASGVGLFAGSAFLFLAVYGFTWFIEQIQNNADLMLRDRRYEPDKIILKRDGLILKLNNLMQGVEWMELKERYRQAGQTIEGLLEDRVRLRASLPVVREMAQRYRKSHKGRGIVDELHEKRMVLETGLAETENRIDEVLVFLDTAEAQLRVSIDARRWQERRLSETPMPMNDDDGREGDVIEVEFPSSGRVFEGYESETTIDGATQFLQRMDDRVAEQRARMDRVERELGTDPTFTQRMERALESSPSKMVVSGGGDSKRAAEARARARMRASEPPSGSPKGLDRPRRKHPKGTRPRPRPKREREP